jgi:MscS family membrane protein
MAIRKKQFKTIILLSVIFIVSELIYLGFKKEVIKIDPLIVTIVETFLTLIISLLVISIILKFTSNRVWTMFEKEMELEQRIIVSRLYSISLYSIALFITFWKAGVSLGNLTLFIGLIATGFAFAIRDLLLSFFAWFIILNKKPFQMGDYIKIGEESGLVTRIGTFFFTLELQYPDEFIKIPNSQIMTKSIHNKGEGKFREEIKFALKQIPEDLEQKLNVLGTFIRTRSAFKEHVKTTLVSDISGWYIYIAFPTNYKQDHLKAAIFIEAHRLFEQELKLTQ